MFQLIQPMKERNLSLILHYALFSSLHHQCHLAIAQKGWVDIFDIFLDIAAINKNWGKKIPGPIIACNNGVSRALKGVKNAVHMVLFPFKPSLFPTDETLVDSLLKACDSMTHNTKVGDSYRINLLKVLTWKTNRRETSRNKPEEQTN